MSGFFGVCAAATLLLLQLTSASNETDLTSTSEEIDGLIYEPDVGRKVETHPLDLLVSPVATDCAPYAPEQLEIMDLETREQVFGDLLDSPHQITETELRGFCKVQAKLSTCMVKHEVSGFPEPRQSVYNRTQLPLGVVCERPDFFTKAQVLLGCARAAARVYRKYTQEEGQTFHRQNEKCLQEITGAPRFLGLYLLPFPYEPLTFHDETAMLTATCCRLKRIVSCLPRVKLIRQECTFEAVDLGRAILKGVFAYYNCPDTLAANVCTEAV